MLLVFLLFETVNINYKDLFLLGNAIYNRSVPLLTCTGGQCTNWFRWRRFLDPGHGSDWTGSVTCDRLHWVHLNNYFDLYLPIMCIIQVVKVHRTNVQCFCTVIKLDWYYVQVILYWMNRLSCPLHRYQISVRSLPVYALHLHNTAATVISRSSHQHTM